MVDNEVLETPAISVGTKQPDQEPMDVNAPVEPLDIRLNFNCLLYVFTELVGLFNRQIEALHDKQILSDEDVQRIYTVTADKEELTKVYNAVFNRFMEYYVATKKDVLAKQAAADTGEAPSAAPVEDEVPETDPAGS